MCQAKVLCKHKHSHKSLKPMEDLRCYELHDPPLEVRKTEPFNALQMASVMLKYQ